MRIVVRVDPKTVERLQELQKKRGFLTISETVRYIISEFFEGERK